MGSPPGVFGAWCHVGFVNWKAPRYSPPPPIASGSLPDSHSAVCRAQRLLWREVRFHMRSYLPPPSPLLVDVPPLYAPAGAVSDARVAARTAIAATNARMILSLGAPAPRARFISTLFRRLRG